MKKCTYCGKEFSDEVAVCPVDQSELVPFSPPVLETSKQSSSNSTTQQNVGCLAYVIGGASFIPLIGIIFGVVAIIWGLLRKVKSLVLLGIGGILFSVILYGALFYFGFYHRGGVYDKLRSDMAVTMLNRTVKDLEYYKLQHGHYPAKLEALKAENKDDLSSIYDPTAMQRKDSKSQYFYYELDSSGTFYFLRSVGPDGIPFTSDDILPTIPEEERIKTGLKLTR
jgi:hypothetical protein